MSALHSRAVLPGGHLRLHGDASQSSHVAAPRSAGVKGPDSLFRQGWHSLGPRPRAPISAATGARQVRLRTCGLAGDGAAGVGGLLPGDGVREQRPPRSSRAFTASSGWKSVQGEKRVFMTLPLPSPSPHFLPDFSLKLSHAFKHPRKRLGGDGEKKGLVPFQNKAKDKEGTEVGEGRRQPPRWSPGLHPASGSCTDRGWGGADGGETTPRWARRGSAPHPAAVTDTGNCGFQLSF